MHKISFAACLVAASILTGCMSRTAVVQMQNNNVGGGQLGVVNKSVLSGQTIDIMSNMTLNPDCTPGTPAAVRIVQQPAHGKAEIVHRDIFPPSSFVALHKDCATVKVPAQLITYTANANFTGTDVMSFETITSSGIDSGEIKVLVTVK